MLFKYNYGPTLAGFLHIFLFCVLAPCSLVGGHRCFGAIHCFVLQYARLQVVLFIVDLKNVFIFRVHNERCPDSLILFSLAAGRIHWPDWEAI